MLWVSEGKKTCWRTNFQQDLLTLHSAKHHLRNKPWNSSKRIRFLRLTSWILFWWINACIQMLILMRLKSKMKFKESNGDFSKKYSNATWKTLKSAIDKTVELYTSQSIFESFFVLKPVKKISEKFWLNKIIAYLFQIWK